ncbi:MAG TPA: outer membrane protein assembly factor BamD [Verrucomicrobiae bacterium]|jgi:TolA-binding protein|nr:outer membrane protein assembly factor BamD [Verrucomicrobiae bacterium]
MVKHWKTFGLLLLLALAAANSFAAGNDRGTLIREETLYASAGANSQKLLQVGRGTGITVLERTNADGQPWVKVSMAADQGPISKEITGWIPAKALVTASTANGDQIIFGQGVDSERQAEERGGRKGAAEDALHLYSRVAELFPGSPLAAEAMWRAADIRWQLTKFDFQRSGTPMEEKYLKEVIAKFPQSKQAELAAFDLLEGKLCAEWRGQAECPEKEAVLYEQYAHEHPQSPKAAEALYNAAWRQAALTDIYRIDNNRDKSEAARKKALALSQEIGSKYPEGDWKPRAVDLIYKLEKKITLYGPAEE